MECRELESSMIKSLKDKRGEKASEVQPKNETPNFRDVLQLKED